jgi:hypothetical protein
MRHTANAKRARVAAAALPNREPHRRPISWSDRIDILNSICFCGELEANLTACNRAPGCRAHFKSIPRTLGRSAVLLACQAQECPPKDEGFRVTIAWPLRRPRNNVTDGAMFRFLTSGRQQSTRCPTFVLGLLGSGRSCLHVVWRGRYGYDSS